MDPNDTRAGRHAVRTPLAPAEVVVPLDGSVLARAALVPAVALAHKVGASVHLLSTRWDDSVEGPRHYLEAKAATLGLDHVDITIDLERRAPDAILLAATRPGSIVCMASHGRSRVREGAVGSVAGEVLARSVHPLLLVGPRALTRSSTFEAPAMGIALDGSATADSILPVAIEWAALLDLQPWLLAVVDPSSLPAGVRVVEGAHLATVSHDLRGRARVEWTVLHGDDPASALVDRAVDHDAPLSLLALTSHGRTGAAHLAYGSVTSRLLHRSPCPLLVTGPRHG